MKLTEIAPRTWCDVSRIVWIDTVKIHLDSCRVWLDTGVYIDAHVEAEVLVALIETVLAPPVMVPRSIDAFPVESPEERRARLMSYQEDHSSWCGNCHHHLDEHHNELAETEANLRGDMMSYIARHWCTGGGGCECAVFVDSWAQGS